MNNNDNEFYGMDRLLFSREVEVCCYWRVVVLCIRCCRLEDIEKSIRYFSALSSRIVFSLATCQTTLLLALQQEPACYHQ